MNRIVSLMSLLQQRKEGREIYAFILGNVGEGCRGETEISGQRYGLERKETK